MDPEAPLSWTAVENALQERRDHKRRLVDEVRIDVELYNQEFKLDMPEGFHQIKSPASKALCDRFADRLGGGKVQVDIPVRRLGLTEERHTGDLEAACAAILYQSKRRTHYNPIRAMALHSANRGGFVPKMLMRNLEYLASNAPKERDYSSKIAYTKAAKLFAFKQLSNFPMMLDVRPIEAIYPDTETDGEVDVIEHYLRRVGSIKANFPEWDGWKGQLEGRKAKARLYRDNEVVQYTEAWTPNWRGAWVDGVPLPWGKFAAGPVKNPYGRPVYWIRYSGYGDPAGEPHQKCVSLLRAIRDVLRSDSRILSILDTLAENEGYGATILKKGDSGNTAFSIGPGAINEMDDPEGPRQFKTPGIQQGTLDMHSIIQAAIEQGAVPGEAIGQPSAGRGKSTPSGVAAAILTGQASMIVDPTKDAIQEFLSDYMSFALYVFDSVIGEELPVYGQIGEDRFADVVLGPKLIDGHYGPIYVQLELREPEDDYAREQLGLTALQAGAPPEWVFEHFFRVDDPQSFVRDMMAKQIAYSPDVRTYLVGRLIQRLQAIETQGPDKIPGQNVSMPASYSTPVPAPPVQMALPANAGPSGGNGGAPRGAHRMLPLPAPPPDARTRAESKIAQVTGQSGQALGPVVSTGPQ